LLSCRYKIDNEPAILECVIRLKFGSKSHGLLGIQKNSLHLAVHLTSTKGNTNAFPSSGITHVLSSAVSLLYSSSVSGYQLDMVMPQV
jgi:hypothetical protein